MYSRPLPPPKRRRPSRKKIVLSMLVLLIAASYSTVVLTRPFNELQPSVSRDSLSITTQASNLPWPSYGQGAFGLSDGTVVATHGDQTPVPIASAAKVITALVVLQKHPLQAGQAGPTITLHASDVALYNQYVADHGSVVPVYAGQQLTERQMLEALMLPSANNIADSLAIWAYGSVDAYLSAATTYLKAHALNQTHVGGDASGFSPESTSSTSDLVKLGSLAIRSPALAAVVAEKSAAIPGVGTVKNVNNLLGSNNIVGVKTGNNDQNGGVFIGAATRTVAGAPVTIITALSGAPTLNRVLADSATLLATIQTTFAETNIVQGGTVLGNYHDSQGHLLQAVAAKDLDLLVLRGTSVKGSISVESISYRAKVGQQVGQVTVMKTAFAPAGSVPIILKQAPSKPSLIYRLTHP